MILVITEKGSQVEAFGRFINMRFEGGFNVAEYNGDEFVFIALSGHIFEMDSSSVDLLNFIPPTNILKRVPKQEARITRIHKKLKELSKELNRIHKIILATDPDKEGCAIGKETLEYYGFDRVGDITYMDIHNTSPKPLKKEFDRAITTGRDSLDWKSMANAGHMIADFNHTGLAISHSLTEGFKKQGENAFYTFGTQQIRALYLIVKRYREHEGFDKSPHYRIKVKTKKGTFDVFLNEEIDKKDKSVIDAIASQVGDSVEIKKVVKKKVMTRSQKWYDGSQIGTLTAKETKESFTKIFSSKTSIMQNMYQNGIITYIRGEAKGKMPIADIDIFRAIAKDLAPYYNAPRLNTSLTKEYLWRKEDSKSSVNHTPCTLADALNPKKFSGTERVVFDIAAKQILSVFYPETVKGKIGVAGVSGAVKVILEDSKDIDVGVKEIYGKKGDTFDNPDTESIKEGDSIPIQSIDVEEYKPPPPSLYTEATFVEDLKRKKVGSESTFGSYADKLLDREIGASGKPIVRGYAKLNKKGQIIPTEKGLFLIDTIPEDLRDTLNLFDEKAISKYLNGEIDIDKALLYKANISLSLYNGILEVQKNNMAGFLRFSEKKSGNYKKVEKIPLNCSCPNCGSNMVLANGKAQCVEVKMSKVGTKWENNGACSFSLFVKSDKFYKYSLEKDEVDTLVQEGQIRKSIFKIKGGINKDVTLKFNKESVKIEVLEV